MIRQPERNQGQEEDCNSKLKNLSQAEKRHKLASLIGNYEFGSAAQELEKMRDDRIEHLISQVQAAKDRRKEEE